MIMEAQVRRINWGAQLIHIIGQHTWRDRESTRKRPNRRMEWLQPGNRTKCVDKDLVAIDTSGSIDDGLLARFLNIINQLSQDYLIDVMQFDCEKTQDPVPYDRRKNRYSFKGRGGTDFGRYLKSAITDGTKR